MRQYDIALYKYWVTQSGHFRLLTTVALGMGITDEKFLYCHGVAKGNEDKKISTSEYNNRTVYYFLNNTFIDDFGIPALNPPPINFDDITHPHKISRYTPDLFPAAIYVAPENYFSTLTTPSDSPDILPSDDTNTLYVMKMVVPILGMVCRRY